MISASPKTCRWDIFCTVIDNFGDIGICWRFSRQLVAEHQQMVRLWVDDLHSFQRIYPEINPEWAVQHCCGVEIRFWSKPLPALTVADIPDVVIEAFACTIPDNYLQLMAERAAIQPKKPPLWLNMEYLSAEDWILGYHGLNSPHPRYKLQKTFFFPGFVAGTGGLLREKNLLAERDAFCQNPEAQVAFWQEVGIPAAQSNELRISLFGYDNPVTELVTLWSQSPTPISLCAAEGKLAQQLAEAIGLLQGQTAAVASTTATTGHPLCHGSLTLHILPFLEQRRYDRLLWACDINFVRGEDSFVRAQWAGKPFVWQVYRQEESTHLIKLDAFLALYTKGLPAAFQQDLEQFWYAWNKGNGIAAAWPDFLAAREILLLHNNNWIKNMQNVGDFTTNMMLYCQKYL